MSPASKSVSFRTAVGVRKVSRDQILTAMKQFDMKFRSIEDDSGTLYAVDVEEKKYPPKRILELATGVPRNQFYGGKSSNDVFIGLGFLITESDSSKGINPDRIVREQARLNEPIPDVNQLAESMFARRWVHFDDDSKLPDSQYAGVYVLAYPHKGPWGDPLEHDLAGEQVREEEVFYVGVSHAGVRKRLRQFAAGLEDGRHHSGAKRFFHDVAKGKPYYEFAERKPFFVASVSVPCTVVKPARTPLDLRKLGVVAQLEWYVLARVKEKTQKEPWLNKK